MKSVIIYSNRKVYPPMVWDSSTPELREKAILGLFEYLDEGWGVYGDLLGEEEGEDFTPEPPLFLEPREHWAQRVQRELYAKAKAGDAAAAERLLNMRRGGEYELWAEEEVL